MIRTTRAASPQGAPSLGHLHRRRWTGDVTLRFGLAAVTLAVTAVVAVLSLLLITGFDTTTAKFQFAEHHAWVQSLNIQYVVGVDGISILLVILTAGRERMPRSWLGLAGLLFAVTLLEQSTAAPRLYFLYTTLSYAPWVVLGAVILWAAVDARPAVAMAIYLASNYVIFTLIGYAGYGAGPAAAWEWYLPIAGVAVLGACALWRLRRQAVL